MIFNNKLAINSYSKHIIEDNKVISNSFILIKCIIC